MVLGHFVEGTRIESIVPQELVDGTVQRVGSTPHDDVYLPSTGSSHFGRVAARQDFEFLDGVGRRAQVQRIEGRVRVRRPVEEEIICIGAIASHTYCGSLARAPV